VTTSACINGGAGTPSKADLRSSLAMHSNLSVLLALVTAASAFPSFSRGGLSRSPRSGDAHAFERRDAVPYSAAYPYTGAKIDGLPGTQLGGVRVPARGDTVHAYQDPPEGAMRGPWCVHLRSLRRAGRILTRVAAPA
jgi:hypothetical protein